MDGDLWSSYNLDDRLYCARGDRYLGLRFGSASFHRYRSRWYFQMAPR
jgi:hypothetical protein